MARTPGERITALEVSADDLERRLTAVENTLNSGGDVAYAHSVRGRLHALEGNLAAMGVVTKQRVRLLRGWQAAILTACALVTAAAAVVSALHVVTGG